MSLEAIADLQPGMSEYVMALARRYHVLYYAAYAARDGSLSEYPRAT